MQTQTKTQVIYDPAGQRLTFIRDNKPVGGMIGKAAERQFVELLETGRDVKLSAMRTKSQKVRALRALWIKQGIDHHRRSIMEPYGVESTRDLNEEQLDELIVRFSKPKDSPVEIRKSRSVAIMLLQDLGVYKNDGSWGRVNEYLMNPRIAGKLLYQMNLAELKNLAAKLRSIKSKQANATNPNLN